jgi:hypothetical protein
MGGLEGYELRILRRIDGLLNLGRIYTHHSNMNRLIFQICSQKFSEYIDFE